MFLFLFLPILLGLATAENGIDAWLRYAPLPSSYRTQFSFRSSIVTLNSTKTSPVYTAGQELQKGIKGIFGKSVPISYGKQSSHSIVVGTLDEYTKVYGDLETAPELEQDGFWLSNTGSFVQILGQNERGALYGAFEYLSMLAQGNISKIEYVTNPNGQLR